MKTILVTMLLTAICVKGHLVSDKFKRLDEEWEEFKVKYKKSFKTLEEEQIRESYFSKTIDAIVHHNKLNELGKYSYSMAINKFADMSEEEKATYRGYKDTDVRHFGKTLFRPNVTAVVPNQLDWRTEGAVTEVKNSGRNCKSGWAFSAVGALESQYFRKTGKLVNLSAQNIIDCAYKDGSNGCGGGNPMDAYSYVFFNNGIESENSYPYIGKEQLCKYKVSGNVTSIKFFVDFGVGSNEEILLKEAVALIGPISTDIYVDDTFYLYDSGIYYNKYCKRDQLSHSVLVVGYGTTKDKPPLDYWLVKNSWGSDWGERGYIRMSRNRSNNCGIGSHPTFPILY